MIQAESYNPRSEAHGQKLYRCPNNHSGIVRRRMKWNWAIANEIKANKHEREHGKGSQNNGVASGGGRGDAPLPNSDICQPERQSRHHAESIGTAEVEQNYTDARSQSEQQILRRSPRYDQEEHASQKHRCVKLN